MSAAIADLPFGANAFDLAVLLAIFVLGFGYSLTRISSRAIEEMCRVAQEAQNFSLLNYNSETFAFCRTAVEVLAMRGNTHPSKSFLRVSARWKPDAPIRRRPTHEQMDARCRHRLTAAWILRCGPNRSGLRGYDVDVHREHVLRNRFAQNPDGWLISRVPQSEFYGGGSGWPKPTIR